MIINYENSNTLNVDWMTDRIRNIEIEPIIENDFIKPNPIIILWQH
jgi:hypothetical protein